MNAQRDFGATGTIAALAGASVGVLEATFGTTATGWREGTLVLCAGAFGYAACAFVLTALWQATRRSRPDVEARWSRATAACLPFGLFAALLPITHVDVSDGLSAIALRVLAALALGAQLTWLLRMGAVRVAVLQRTSTWGSLLVAVLAVAAADLVLDGRTRVAAVPASAEGLPNVLLITVDTLRADRVGAYGAGPDRTPEMDRMAAEGVRFLDAVAPAPLTCPSHASILTGLYPIQHGARHNGTPLPPATPTLPEVLARRGYRTGAIVSGYTLKHEACGLGDRFASYDDDLSPWRWLPDRIAQLRLWELAGRVVARAGWRPFRADRPAGPTTDRALRWIERQGDAPFFLWVHYFDPHVPYEPPPPYRVADPELAGLGHWYHEVSREEKEAVANDPDAVAAMIALYDGEVAYVDAQLGRLREGLARKGLDRDTLVILTADHGESLGEHEYYFEHSNYLYEEELRVPLILVPPDGGPGGREVEGPVRLIDLAPTILGYVGMEDALETEGRSLWNRIEGDAPETGQDAFAAVHPGAWESGRSIYALRSEGYKLIWTSPEWRFYGMRLEAREELYHLPSDPRELRDLADAAPPVIEALRRELQRWRAEEGADPSASDRPVDAELERRLRSLGYAE